MQVTTEAGAAFDPSWSVTGHHIVYATVAGTPRLRTVPAGGGGAADYAVLPDTALGEPSCGAYYCVAVRGAYGDDGDLVAFGAPRAASGGVGVPPIPPPTTGVRVLVEGTGNDRQPAIVPE